MSAHAVIFDERVAAKHSLSSGLLVPKARATSLEIAISQLDCFSCSNCVYICLQMLDMKPIEEQESVGDL